MNKIMKMMRKVARVNRKNAQRGFTLIELVLVIAILGILAVVALPTLFNTTLTAAKSNSMGMTASAIQEAVGIYSSDQVAQGHQLSYPTTLDAATAGAASPTNPLFGGLLQQGVTSSWIKVSATCYVYDVNGTGVVAAGDTYFQYTPATGVFVTVSTCS